MFVAGYFFLIFNDVDVQSQKQSNTSITDNKDCSSYVRFKIGEVNYQIDPRQKVFFDWRDLEGNPHSSKEISSRIKNCESIDLGEISYYVSAGENGISISEYSTGQKNPLTTYQRYKDKIDQARRENTVIVLANRVEKLVTKRDELYILPTKIAPTGNGEPVLLLCDRKKESDVRSKKYFLERCATNFMNTDGNYIGDYFLRKFFSEDQLLEGYQAILKNYKKYKFNGENKL